MCSVTILLNSTIQHVITALYVSVIILLDSTIQHVIPALYV